MNITFCAYDTPTHIGGPNTVLRRLLPALHAQGEHPEALLFHSGGRATGATAADLQRAGVPVQRIPRPRSTEALLHRVLRASAGTDVFAPDYVAPAYFAARWLRPAGVVTIGAIHGDDPFYDALIDEFVLGPPEQQIDGLVCVSHFVEGRVQARIAGQATRTTIRCIPNSTPLPTEFARPPAHDLRMIYVGRLAETHKRALDVTRAICRAVRAVPGTSGALFGDGPSRRLVEDTLARDGAGLPIQLHGSVSGERIGEELLRSQARNGPKVWPATQERFAMNETTPRGGASAKLGCPSLAIPNAQAAKATNGSCNEPRPPEPSRQRSKYSSYHARSA